MCGSEVESLHSMHKTLGSTPGTTKGGRVKRMMFTSNIAVLEKPTKMANFCSYIGRKDSNTGVSIYELQLFIPIFFFFAKTCFLN